MSDKPVRPQVWVVRSLSQESAEEPNHRIIVGTMVRDGYIYGLSFLAVAGLLKWATGSWAWVIAPLLLAVFFLWFFRDPRRAVPAGAGLIVSPGDGLVTETATIATSEGPGSGSASSSAFLMCT